VNFVLADAAGNNSTAFTTPISQTSDAIDANTPTVTVPALDASVASTLDPTVSKSSLPMFNFQAEAGATVEVDFGDGAGFIAAGVGTGSNQSATLGAALITDGNYTFRVRVTDAAGNVGMQSLAYSVNRPPTDLALSANEVDENSAGGTLIGNLSVTDPTGGDTHNLALVNSAGGLFTLNGNRLEVASGAVIDFETASTHTIEVSATDQAGSTHTKTFTVDVRDLIEGLTGDANNNTLEGSSGTNTIDAGTGDDTVSGKGGSDTITLGAGKDTLLDTLANTNGTRLTDFGEDDQFIFTDQVFGPGAITLTNGSNGGPSTLSIDVDGDGTPETQITLDTPLNGGQFLVFEKGGQTVVSYERPLPALTEGQAMDLSNANGIVNQTFLAGDGSNNYRVTLDSMSGATFQNLLGVYEVTPTGEITDVRVLFANTSTAAGQTVNITGVENGNELGFFVVMQGAFAGGATDTFDFVDSLGGAAEISDGTNITMTVNGAGSAFPVWHSFASTLNSDGVQHAVSGVQADGRSIIIGFEDQLGGGDRDYQDIVIQVELF
jgi:hypothetical protein